MMHDGPSGFGLDHWHRIAPGAVDPTLDVGSRAPRERTSEPKECTAMQKLRLLSATLGLLAVASCPAEPADDIKPPAGYRHWFHVNTMIIDKGARCLRISAGCITSTSIRWERPRSRRAGRIATRPYSQPTCTSSRSPTALTWKAPEKAWP